MPVSVALCGDRHVLPGMAVTVRSALESSTGTIDVHVICSGVSASDKERLRQSWNHPNCGQVHFVDIERGKINNFRSTTYLKSKVAYARYFIANIFSNIDRCVYLDTDLLVLRDLQETNAINLGKNIAGAVRDISVRVKPVNSALKQRLDLSDERDYFNSGFMLISFEAWRREHLTDKLVRISIERFDEMNSQDQDALNVILDRRVLLMDEKWNTSQYEKPYPLPGYVIHLIGYVKPWHARYAENFRESYYEEVIYATFTEILSRTEFRNWRPWNFLGLGKYAERINRRIPTTDMVLGKLRRVTRSGFRSA